ncbi:MAG: hypothetical protein AAGI90_02360 [Chlamydiota bacterium]
MQSVTTFFYGQSTCELLPITTSYQKRCAHMLGTFAPISRKSSLFGVTMKVSALVLQALLSLPCVFTIMMDGALYAWKTVTRKDPKKLRHQFQKETTGKKLVENPAATFQGAAAHSSTKRPAKRPVKHPSVHNRRAPIEKRLENTVSNPPKGKAPESRQSPSISRENDLSTQKHLAGSVAHEKKASSSPKQNVLGARESTIDPSEKKPAQKISQKREQEETEKSSYLLYGAAGVTAALAAGSYFLYRNAPHHPEIPPLPGGITENIVNKAGLAISHKICYPTDIEKTLIEPFSPLSMLHLLREKGQQTEASALFSQLSFLYQKLGNQLGEQLHNYTYPLRILSRIPRAIGAAEEKVFQSQRLFPRFQPFIQKKDQEYYEWVLENIARGSIEFLFDYWKIITPLSLIYMMPSLIGHLLSALRSKLTLLPQNGPQENPISQEGARGWALNGMATYLMGCMACHIALNIIAEIPRDILAANSGFAEHLLENHSKTEKNALVLLMVALQLYALRYCCKKQSKEIEKTRNEEKVAQEHKKIVQSPEKDGLDQKHSNTLGD